MQLEDDGIEAAACLLQEDEAALESSAFVLFLALVYGLMPYLPICYVSGSAENKAITRIEFDSSERLSYHWMMDLNS